jgi:hypothetical protein
MKEFVLIFRSNRNPHANPTPAQIQERMEWMNGNKLSSSGNRLSASHAHTVRAGDVVTEGPYKDGQEFINGYLIVKADHIGAAIELAKTNPILKDGGNIEVRAVLMPGDKDL